VEHANQLIAELRITNWPSTGSRSTDERFHETYWCRAIQLRFLVALPGINRATEITSQKIL